jgi:hypothetical protein
MLLDEVISLKRFLARTDVPDSLGIVNYLIDDNSVAFKKARLEFGGVLPKDL